MTPGDLLTTAQAAERIGISASRLRSIVADGYRPVRGRLGREWLWTEADVDALRVRRPKGWPPGERNPNSRARRAARNITKQPDELARVS